MSPVAEALWIIGALILVCLSWISAVTTLQDADKANKRALKVDERFNDLSDSVEEIRQLIKQGGTLADVARVIHMYDTSLNEKANATDSIDGGCNPRQRIKQ
jgi:hypothetical protein